MIFINFNNFINFLSILKSDICVQIFKNFSCEKVLKCLYIHRYMWDMNETVNW